MPFTYVQLPPADISYPGIFDQLLAVLLVPGAGRPLPVDLDAVDDALAVEGVHGGGQVGEAAFRLEEAAEDGGADGLAPEAGQEAGGGVLLAEVGQVGEGA